ncbi:hypothetical protein P4S95_04885 [Aneurinibacillus aneurinilyticus]|uniref:tetratricopeptide repeat protein n=1 Tax=Aneurinibacillus aneurinilyticus TaxID=1391 RepID=UPI002E22B835|nr:hypothetical protein [Aneurinibacillus aneurinilyticus]
MNDSYTVKQNLTSSSKTFQGRVHRIAIYLQSKVLEIIDSNDSAFYLIYFKNSILGGGELEEITEKTFLYKAFREGIVCYASHPLFPLLLPKGRTIHLPKTNDIFTQLQNHLSLLEVSLAATCMDNFIEKQQLVSIIRQIFNHFKRNGHFAKAYQTAKILLAFSPGIRAIQEIIRASEFEKYRKIEQPPLLMELFYYQNRTERKCEIYLHQLLKQQSRSLERLILFINLFEIKHDFYDFPDFLSLLKHELKPTDQYAVLKFLCECSPAYSPLIEQLIQEQISLKRYPEALSFIVNRIPQLSSTHYEIIERIIEHVDTSYILHLPNVNQIINHLYLTEPAKKEDLVRRLITNLLKIYEPSKVKEWLHPIRENNSCLQICSEVDELESLSRNLDQLMKLGELYYQLGLVDQSIECFAWEMELNPTLLEPIRWLSKLYEEKGMREEADNYKKLSIHMAKRA